MSETTGEGQGPLNPQIETSRTAFDNAQARNKGERFHGLRSLGRRFGSHAEKQDVPSGFSAKEWYTLRDSLENARLNVGREKFYEGLRVLDRVWWPGRKPNTVDTVLQAAKEDEIKTGTVLEWARLLRESSKNNLDKESKEVFSGKIEGVLEDNIKSNFIDSLLRAASGESVQELADELYENVSDLTEQIRNNPSKEKLDLLRDKVVVITGSAGGIGSEMTEKYLENGAIVYAIDNNAEGLHMVVEKLREKGYGDNLHEVAADISKEEEWIPQLDHLEKIDVLINNAAIVDPILDPNDPESMPPKLLEYIKMVQEPGGFKRLDSELLKVLMADAIGALKLSLFVSGKAIDYKNNHPEYNEEFNVVNIGSTNVETGKKDRLLYILAKSMLKGMNKFFAQELADEYKIKNNMVSPGYTVGGMAQGVSSGQPFGPSNPEDIFNATVYLIGANTTGVEIYSDGGRVSALTYKK